MTEFVFFFSFLIPPWVWLFYPYVHVSTNRSLTFFKMLFKQVTRFRDNGFAVGYRYCHSVLDGFGMAKLLDDVYRLAVGEAFTVPPAWERELRQQGYSTDDRRGHRRWILWPSTLTRARARAQRQRWRWGVTTCGRCGTCWRSVGCRFSRWTGRSWSGLSRRRVKLGRRRHHGGWSGGKDERPELLRQMRDQWRRGVRRGIYVLAAGSYGQVPTADHFIYQ